MVERFSKMKRTFVRHWASTPSRSIKYFTTSKCPCRAALWSGVSPFLESTIKQAYRSMVSVNYPIRFMGVVHVVVCHTKWGEGFTIRDFSVWRKRSLPKSIGPLTKWCGTSMLLKWSHIYRSVAQNSYLLESNTKMRIEAKHTVHICSNMNANAPAGDIQIQLQISTLVGLHRAI